jgi:antitoxin component YwqK of YwqJK toxin-antitoxin module
MSLVRLLHQQFSLTEKYDPSGRATGKRSRIIVDDPISRMLVYPFDENITRIEKPIYWEKGIPPGWKYGPLIYTDVYTYDNKTRHSEWLRYGPDGKIELRSSNVFDELGRLGETKSYNADGALADWNVITRDQRGNVVESAFYKEDGTLMTVHDGDTTYLNQFLYTYTFDSAGNWITAVMSRPVLRNGQSVPEPCAFKYRSITYY